MKAGADIFDNWCTRTETEYVNSVSLQDINPSPKPGALSPKPQTPKDFSFRWAYSGRQPADLQGSAKHTWVVL